MAFVRFPQARYVTAASESLPFSWSTYNELPCEWHANTSASILTVRGHLLLSTTDSTLRVCNAKTVLPVPSQRLSESLTYLGVAAAVENERGRGWVH
jgi:hypothetical protein